MALSHQKESVSKMGIISVVIASLALVLSGLSFIQSKNKTQAIAQVESSLAKTKRTAANCGWVNSSAGLRYIPHEPTQLAQLAWRLRTSTIRLELRASSAEDQPRGHTTRAGPLRRGRVSRRPSSTSLAALCP